MNGRDVLTMFGDRSLLTLEEQRDRLGAHTHEMERELAALREDPEADWKVVSKLENDLDQTRDTLRKTNQEIRKLAQDFGKKRGLPTLH